MTKKLSLLDPGGVQKDVHAEHAHALRVRDANSQVPGGYSRAEFTKNAQESITKAVFYRGTACQKTRIKFFDDIAGSLLGKYWYINTEEDSTEYYVWYSNGITVDPAIAGKVGFEVVIQPNDPAQIVCLATKLILDGCKKFTIETNGVDVLLIENYQAGQTTPSVDVSTGFGVTTSSTGTTHQICSVELPEENGIQYVFNYGERKFELVTAIQVVGPLEVYGTVNVAGITITAGAVANIPALLIDTEYSFTLAIGVKNFEITSRLYGKIKFSYVSGQSGTTYRTISPGSTYDKIGLVLTSPLAVYFQSNKAGDVLEVVTYS